MNLYEISATLPNGAVHKTKVYEINQERASNKGFKFALQFDASGKTTFTTTLIQKNAGVSKDTERAFLNEIKEISGDDTVGYLTTRIQAQIDLNKAAKAAQQ